MHGSKTLLQVQNSVCDLGNVSRQAERETGRLIVSCGDSSLAAAVRIPPSPSQNDPRCIVPGPGNSSMLYGRRHFSFFEDRVLGIPRKDVEDFRRESDEYGKYG